MPRPCLFHIEEDCAQVYLYFAHSLIEANPDVDRDRFIGGDRGKARLDLWDPSDQPLEFLVSGISRIT